MDDLISRQAAINAIERLILPQAKGETAAEEINRVAWRCAINCAEEMIGCLPSAQPEPIKINIDHELTKDEYEKLRKDLADAPIVLIPKSENANIPRWIPVTERCPEKSGDYLVFDDCRNLYVNEWHYLLKKWHYYDSKITHWTPLPEPPKEENE